MSDQITVTLPKKEYDALVEFREKFSSLAKGEIILHRMYGYGSSCHYYEGTEEAIKNIQRIMDEKIKDALYDDASKVVRDNELAKKINARMRLRSWYEIFFNKGK